MEHYCLYLLETPHKQPAIGFWPLAISRTAYSHPNITRSSFQLQAHTQHSQLTPAVQPEASSQQLEAAVQQATSNQQLLPASSARSQQPEARSGCSRLFHS